MATRKMNLFEKMANSFGVIYRYHAAHFPRRWEVLKAIGKHELAPPKTTDWPIIKAEWRKVAQYIQLQQYKNLTVREFLVYSAVALEISFWFFIGEMIGRRHIFGYLVPANYVSKDTLKKVKEQESEVKLTF
uniref:ATP synthase subunit g, mitochondrial n=1 Tax=Heterorhabditis bacteriophora TaxID=37862 RepID=A0A1I7WZY5_HETBA